MSWYDYLREHPPVTTPTEDGTSGDVSTNPVTNWGQPKSDNPHKMAAELLSAQFAEWESLFKPIELAALQNVSQVNPQVLTNSVNEARETAIDTSNATEGILNRRLAAFGVTPTEQQKSTMKRITDIDRSLNIASAENQARTLQRTLDNSILMGSSPNPNIINAATNPV
jgi:hypothetical protein